MKLLLLVFVCILLSGCGKAIESLQFISDNDKRIELQKSAEKTMEGIYLTEKIDSSKVCDMTKPAMNRYLCWRYYEIGGDIWTYLWFGLDSVHGGTILITNNTPIAIGGNGWRYSSDKNKKNELGYEIVKGAMMPPKREKLIQPNKEKNELLYEKYYGSIFKK